MRVPAGLRLLHRHARDQGPAARRLAAWSAVEAAPTFASGLLLATAIDHGFLARKPLTGLAWLAVLGALYVLGALATRQVYPWLAATVEPLRDSLIADVVAASLRRMTDGRPAAGGAGVSQVTEQVEAVRALLATAIRNLRQLLSAGVAALLGLVLLSPLLALVITAFVVLGLAAFAAFLRIQITRYRAVIRYAEDIGETATPIVQGVRDVVACAAEDRAARTVAVAIDAQAEALRAFARSRLLRLPVLTLAVHVPLLTLLAMSPWLIEHGHLTPGQVAGGVGYLVSGLQPGIVVLVDAGGTLLLSLAVVLTRLAQICEDPDAATAEASSTAETFTTVAASTTVPTSYGISVDRVTFAYSPHAGPVFTDLSLRITEGAHLAVVGPSGAGKSTLASLLTGLAEPQRGGIGLGGVPLDRIGTDRLRRTVTLIPQEAYVFAATLRENLTYLRPRATASDLEAAVGAVGLGETVERLGGFGAEIPPGGGALSQGERQLITLARAYLSTAPVTILDEATCHLHPAAEAQAERALAARGGTLIVIAHRISSAQRADQVLLIDGPRPLLGTHETLLGDSPLYAELVGHWKS